VKKGKIAVAVFAVLMAAASVARAGGSDVDFDGAGKGSASLLETIKTDSESSSSLIPSIPVRSWYGNINKQSQVAGVGTGEIGTEILGITIKGTSKQKVLKDILKQYLSAKSDLDSNTAVILEHSDTQILFDEENVYIQTRGNNVPLYEIKNRALVNTIKIVLAKDIPQNKQYCEFVETVVMQLMWKTIFGVWTQVWEETVKLVKVCHDGTPPSTPSAPYECASPMYGCTMDNNCHQLCE